MNKKEMIDLIVSIRKSTDKDFVRVSIANLLSDVNSSVIGIINKRYYESRGEKILSSIGGSALLHDQKAIEDIGGYDFEDYDSRFKLPISSIPKLIDLIINDNERGVIFEQTPDREVDEELTEETIPGIIEEPILLPIDSFLLNTKYNFMHVEHGEGIRKKRDYLTVYFWKFFILYCTKEIISKLSANPAIRILTKEEIRRGYSKDGIEIGRNVLIAGKIIHKL